MWVCMWCLPSIVITHTHTHTHTCTHTHMCIHTHVYTHTHTHTHTHTQVQPVIDGNLVPAKTNASTGQVMSPQGPSEAEVVKTPPTQEVPPATSIPKPSPVPAQPVDPKPLQTNLDNLLGSWSSSTAGWFKKVSAGYDGSVASRLILYLFVCFS